MTQHPRLNKRHQSVSIVHPHAPTPWQAWLSPEEVAVAVPAGSMPPALNGIPLASWREVPTERAGWTSLAVNTEFEDPPFDPKGLKPAAGAVVVEADGRVWVVAPTNAFLGTKATFPKGTAKGLDLRTTALKEVFEETGLQVELFAHLVDVSRSASRTRYYLAWRVGGNPADMDWESQAVMLAPVEELKGLLNKAFDHEVVDVLLEQWGSWASWWHGHHRVEPDLEEARSGHLPARRSHWPALPLPKARITIPLDLRLTRAEAECLKLGFIPRQQEQKWFAYFEGDTLFEHRSWTGFCISMVHFIPDGEGLRATHAEVNRTPSQYSNTDVEEDRRLILERVLQLAHLTPEERNAEDPFVTGWKQAMVPNYLGNPEVVRGLLEPYFDALLQQRVALAQGVGFQEACSEVSQLNASLAKIFAGEDSAYPPIGTWHSAEGLGATVISCFGLDTDYLADENLFCILSEALAALNLQVTELAKAYEEDLGGDLQRDLLPKVAELLHFTTSVLMGTNPVFAPGQVLQDITYNAHTER